MNGKMMRDSVSRELLAATEEAVRAARIDHYSALKEALDKRERLIAEIFDLDPAKPLPQYKEGKVSSEAKDIGRKYRDYIIKIKETEKILFQLLHMQGNRLRATEGQLRGGRRYARGARQALPLASGRRLDRQG